jgi:peroxiredoxin
VFLAATLATWAGAAPPLQEGDPAPALTLTDLAGQTWDLAGLRGKVVHLAFVAVWCDPCQQEATTLRDLSQRYGRKGYRLLLIGVAARQDTERLSAWVARQGLDHLPVVYDARGQAGAALHADLLPHHVLIDRQGTVRLPGGPLPADPGDRILALLAESP